MFFHPFLYQGCNYICKSYFLAYTLSLLAEINIMTIGYSRIKTNTSCIKKTWESHNFLYFFFFFFLKFGRKRRRHKNFQNFDMVQKCIFFSFLISDTKEREFLLFFKVFYRLNFEHKYLQNITHCTHRYLPNIACFIHLYLLNMAPFAIC